MTCALLSDSQLLLCDYFSWLFMATVEANSYANQFTNIDICMPPLQERECMEPPHGTSGILNLIAIIE